MEVNIKAKDRGEKIKDRRWKMEIKTSLCIAKGVGL
jgi:hypothetical protein